MFLTFAVATSAFLSGELPRISQHQAISITALSAHSVEGKHSPTKYTPTPSDAFFVLVIGNDFRPGVGGKRADAIHLIGINPKDKKASIINFPRDTTVSIPGNGRNKINAANAYGGSALTAQTVEQLVGVKISYILEVDFAGFKGLVNDLGGLDVKVTQSMHDHNSGSNFEPGLVRMNGDQALAFSRDRHSFSTGDLMRTQNQATLLIAALKEMSVKEKTVTSRFESAAFIAKNVSLTNLTVRDLYLLMEVANDIDPANVVSITVPWSGSNTLAPTATNLFNDFKDNAIIDTYSK